MGVGQRHLGLLGALDGGVALSAQGVAFGAQGPYLASASAMASITPGLPSVVQ
jgi:hypothetical protein